MVPRRPTQHVRQRPRPPRRRRSWRPDGVDLRLCDDRGPAQLHLLRTPRPRRAVRHHRRSRGAVPADDSGGGHRDARLCAHRRSAFGRVRRLRGQGTRGPHRRRRTRTPRHRKWRFRAGQGRRIPADRGESAGHGHWHASAGHRQVTRGHRRRTLLARLGRTVLRRNRSRPGHGAGNRSALHPVHLRNHRKAQGRGARQRRPRRCTDVVHAQHLRRRRRSGHVDGIRRRLGCGPLLHRLRPAVRRRHNRPVRGQTRGDSRRRCVLARHLRSRCPRALHRTHCAPGDPQGGPACRRTREIRHQHSGNTLRCR